MPDTLGAPEAPTVCKTDEQITSAKHGGDVGLREDEPMAPTDMPPDASVMEDAADGDPGAPATDADHFSQGIQAEAASILSGAGSAKDKLDKLRRLLKVQGSVDDYRGDGSGGDTTPDVGADLDETDPEPAPEPDADDKDKNKPMTESAPPTAIPAPQPKPEASRKFTVKDGRRLFESVFKPSIDLLNAAGVPVRSATVSALAFMPANQRQAFVAQLAESASRAAPVRSQSAAVGVAETSPRATARRSDPAKQQEPAKVKILETSSDELFEKFGKPQFRI